MRRIVIYSAYESKQGRTERVNYWLAIHYPMSAKERAAEWRYWLFLKNDRPDLRPDDRVFIYQTETNPAYIEDGTTITRPLGRKAVIALVRVTSGPRQLRDGDEILQDGRVHHWKFEVETVLERECDISLYEIRRALRKPGWCARVAGGLMPVSEDEFNRMLAMCR